MPTASPDARSTSDRGPGRPPVPLERIVSAALRIVDEEGAEALTLRSLAARLKGSTATLYRHFSDRAALIRAVVDQVFGEVELDETLLTQATWDVSLRHVAEAMFATLQAHRNVAPLLLADFPSGPHAVGLRERTLEVLQQRGFEPDEALLTYATLARHVLGFGMQVPRQASLAGPGGAASSVDPTTARGSTARPPGSIDLVEEFRYGLTLMIEGLSNRHESPRSNHDDQAL
ncbi:TetR/AcrR family transcriptional regulator [Nocardioides bruguierae]|uniref:TetR/AcrR family transcriptional regulator n=2 Tax=Nocardioides bruguierae TaxID=2945102 RepID=A0A9X2D985_9ACTN|nr:TetR/AcrR family transcriptional regulator [Nocardioides bruguierae]MCL8026916.1 TetR/AcrR family transcriptional regulator [Nocardioides bruguierae]MCM0621379.1 TetR/AcrR family transcriptional regulator [Nocardioides bruguierae]